MVWRSRSNNSCFKNESDACQFRAQVLDSWIRFNADEVIAVTKICCYLGWMTCWVGRGFLYLVRMSNLDALSGILGIFIWFTSTTPWDCHNLWFWFSQVCRWVDESLWSLWRMMFVQLPLSAISNQMKSFRDVREETAISQRVTESACFDIEHALMIKLKAFILHMCCFVVFVQADNDAFTFTSKTSLHAWPISI